MLKLGRFFDNSILILLFLFIICEHHYKFTAIKNISLYLALLFAFGLLFINSGEIWHRIRLNFINSKQILIPLGLFLIYTFLLSFFYPYDYGTYSIKEAFSEFGRGMAFLFIILVYANGDENRIQKFFLSFIVAFLMISLYYAFFTYQNFSNIDTQNLHTSRIVGRGYAFFSDRFLSFVLIGAVLFRQKSLKILSLFMVIVGIAMTILTGARGGYAAVFFEILICALFLFLFYKNLLKSNLKQILISLVLIFGVVFYLFQNSFVFQAKIAQGSDSSGRDVIIKERFPLLFEDSRGFFGLGHGEHLYDKFLINQEKNGHKISLLQPGGKENRHWNNDEPFFVGNYFYYGFFGTLCLFFAIVNLLFLCLKKFKSSKNLLYVAIFASTFSYFGIHGLFETYNLKILYLFYMIGFFILVNSKEIGLKNER